MLRRKALALVLAIAAVYLSPFTGGAARAASAALPHHRPTIPRVLPAVPKVTQSPAASGPRISAPRVSGPAVGFGGQGYGGATPPDTSIAVGNGEIVETVNSTIAVYSESGGAALKSAGLLTFFANGSPGINNAAETDARVFWDSGSQRWFVSGLIFDNSGSTCDSAVMLAVSKGTNPDPTAPASTNWYFIKVSARTAASVPSDSDLQDQPRLGVSGDKLLLGWDDYVDAGSGNCGNAPLYNQVYSSLYVIDKAQALSGTLSGAFAPGYNGYSDHTPEFGITAVSSLTSSTTAWAIWDTSSKIGVIKVTGLPGSLAASETDFIYGAPWIQEPSCECTPEPGGGSVDTGDYRFLSGMQQNNDIWTSANDVCPSPNGTMVCSRLVEIGIASTPTIEQSFDAPTPGEIYPAVTFDDNHNLFVVATHVTATVGPSVDEMFLASGAATSNLTTTTLVSGSGTYNYTNTPGDGKLCATDAGSYCRWGDYSGAAIDPDHAHQVWLAGEYLPASGLSWSTWVAPETASGGEVLDAYGNLNKFGGGATFSQSGSPPWTFNIARGLAVNSSAQGGVILDGYGGLHAFGNSAPAVGDSYWPGWDIARFVISDGSGKGYFVDAWGGLHSYTTTGAWPANALNFTHWTFDICRGAVEFSDGSGGLTLDGYGGVHPWNVQNGPAVAAVVKSPYFYWPNFDIARGILLAPGSTASGYSGFVLDGYGGLHPFYGGTGTLLSYPSPAPYWPYFDIARSAAFMAGSSSSGWIVDGYGGVHPFGNAPSVVSTGYTPGQDLAKAAATTQ